MESKQPPDGRKGGRGGRPRKFHQPSRPVTMTLPESTLRQLRIWGPDRARATAQAVALAFESRRKAGASVDLCPVGDGQSLILVGPSRYLRKVKGLRMAEVAPGRFLLSIPAGWTLSSLEVALHDVEESVSPDDPEEGAMIRRLIQIIRNSRRAGTARQEGILLVSQ